MKLAMQHRMKLVSKIPDVYDPVPVELSIPEKRGQMNIPPSVRAVVEGNVNAGSNDVGIDDFKPTKMSAT